MSANELMLDVSQAHELKMAFRRNGWTNADIKALSEGDFLKDVLAAMKGHAKIKPSRHFIDTDAAPFIPDGMSIEKHVGHGLWQFNLDIELFLSEKQKNKEYQSGLRLKKILTNSGKEVLNANVLDYLLAHPRLIPESWKNKMVCFWGTIYRHHEEGCGLCVRCLRWNGFRWYGDYEFLGSLDHYYPAALAKRE